MPTPAARTILDTSMPPNSNSFQAATIGEYLTSLLAQMWREADGSAAVYAALADAGHLDAARNASGGLEGGTRAADQLVLNAIAALAAPAGTPSPGTGARSVALEQARLMVSPDTTPARGRTASADRLRIQVLRARMDQVREEIVLLSLKSIALQIKEAFPAAAQVVLEIADEWPHGLEPGYLLDCEGNAVTPPPRDEASWKSWSEVADQIRTACNALDTTNEGTWGLFCRPTPGMPPMLLRLKLDDALAIEPASRITPSRPYTITTVIEKGLTSTVVGVEQVAQPIPFVLCTSDAAWIARRGGTVSSDGHVTVLVNKVNKIRFARRDMYRHTFADAPSDMASSAIACPVEWSRAARDE